MANHPRRHPVRKACKNCRKKRAKCDGEELCLRCRNTGQDCVYDESPKITKDELRAEIKRLRDLYDQSTALLDALSNCNDEETYRIVSQGLVDPNISHQVLYERVQQQRSRCSSLSDSGSISVSAKTHTTTPEVQEIDLATSTSHLKNSITTTAVENGALGNSVFGGSGGTSATVGSNGGISVPLANSSPLSPTSSWHNFGPQAGINLMWSDSSQINEPLLAATTTSHTFPFDSPVSSTGSASFNDPDHDCLEDLTLKAVKPELLQQLLDGLSTWDVISSCLVCRHSFLKDFVAGSPRFYSPGLLASIVALSLLVIHANRCSNNYAARNALPLSGSLYDRSQSFYAEAEQLVINKAKDSRSLPDIQAIGILSLYGLRSGNSDQAYKLAKLYDQAIITLRSLEMSTPNTIDGEYVRVRDLSFYGAVILLRHVG